MTEEPSPSSPDRRRSPKARWAEERAEVEAAIAADRLRSAQARAEQEQRLEGEGRSPRVLWLGLLVILCLLGIGWLVVDSMSCDPFYSDMGLARARGCR
jgi:cobalamin biosynthesis Mg chelatase CobN